MYITTTKEGVEEQFPEVVGNSHYEKLWNHLDRRELRYFGLTKVFVVFLRQAKIRLSHFPGYNFDC